MQVVLETQDYPLHFYTHTETYFLHILKGRDIKVESFKVDTRVRHLGRQKNCIGHLGQKITFLA